MTLLATVTMAKQRQTDSWQSKQHLDHHQIIESIRYVATSLCDSLITTVKKNWADCHLI